MAERQGINARLIKTARDVNEYMPHHIALMAEDSLKEIGKSLSNSKISLLGVAYKANVADSRATPAGPLINDLTSQGAEVYAHDPYVDPDIIISKGAKPVKLEEALNSDCVILITDHDQYRKLTPDLIKSPIFICTRPIFNPKEFTNKGFIFKSVGRP
jgi:UDP-N-acetyl-D-mannosaminuronic acid dehydrogenase